MRWILNSPEGRSPIRPDVEGCRRSPGRLLAARRRRRRQGSAAAFRRERMSFAVIFVLPILQLLLFGYAIETDPRHMPTAVGRATTDHRRNDPVGDRQHRLHGSSPTSRAPTTRPASCCNGARCSSSSASPPTSRAASSRGERASNDRRRCHRPDERGQLAGGGGTARSSRRCPRDLDRTAARTPGPFDARVELVGAAPSTTARRQGTPQHRARPARGRILLGEPWC